MENFLGKYKWLMETQKRVKHHRRNTKTIVNFAQEYFHILYLYYKKASENMKKKKKISKQKKQP